MIETPFSAKFEIYPRGSPLNGLPVLVTSREVRGSPLTIPYLVAKETDAGYTFSPWGLALVEQDLAWAAVAEEAHAR